MENDDDNIQQQPQNPARPVKKKLKFDVDDVAEVLERKISP